MTGNVWEWVYDWYAPICFRRSPVDNPHDPHSGDKKVQRGGSWLCSESQYQVYPVPTRTITPPDYGLNNLGFRCVAGAP